METTQVQSQYQLTPPKDAQGRLYSDRLAAGAAWLKRNAKSQLWWAAATCSWRKCSHFPTLFKRWIAAYERYAKIYQEAWNAHASLPGGSAGCPDPVASHRLDRSGALAALAQASLKDLAKSGLAVPVQLGAGWLPIEGEQPAILWIGNAQTCGNLIAAGERALDAVTVFDLLKLPAGEVREALSVSLRIKTGVENNVQNVA